MKSYSFELESSRESSATTGGMTSADALLSDTEFMIHSAFGYRWLKSVPTVKVEILRTKFTEIIEKEEEKRSRPRKAANSSTASTSSSSTTATGAADETLHTVDNIILKSPTSPKRQSQTRQTA